MDLVDEQRSAFTVPNPRLPDSLCPGVFTRVRTCAISGWAAMTASHRNDRNGAPLSGFSLTSVPLAGAVGYLNTHAPTS